MQAHKVKTAEHQGVSHMESSTHRKRREIYKEKHIFLRTDFWIASTQTIQDQRIEDIYQEAGNNINELTRDMILEAVPSNLDGRLQELVAHIRDTTPQ